MRSKKSKELVTLKSLNFTNKKEDENKIKKPIKVKQYTYNKKIMVKDH